MVIDKTNPSHMKNYLKFALEFEKYVHIWTRTMNELNSRLQSVQNKRKSLEIEKNAIFVVAEGTKKVNAKSAEYYGERTKSAVKKTILILAIMIAASFLLGVYLMVTPSYDFGDNKSKVIPITMLVVLIPGLLIMLPIRLGIIFKNKRKADNFEKGSGSSDTEGSRRRQELLLRAREQNAATGIEVIDVEVANITKRQDEVFKALQDAKQNLAQLYAENLLHPKYRNIEAVATMYEYLDTGRCNTINGHGGIYDTYEVERIAIEQLRQMIITNQKLSRIEDYQRYICQQLQQVNSTLSNISTSLEGIERNTTAIARNTAISAVANQQTATAAQWMAWRLN